MVIKKKQLSNFAKNASYGILKIFKRIALKSFILLLFFAWNASPVNVQSDTAVLLRESHSQGQVYLSPTRLVPSNQATGNFIVVKPAER